MGYIGQTITTVFPTSISVDSASVNDDLTVDTNTLKVDSTNNRVGIANASPTATLDVTGAIEADDKITIAYEAGSSDWELESTSGDDFTISRNGSQKLLIDGSTGNVGINETSPDKKVHITEGDGDVLRLERSGAFSGTWDVKIGSQATGDFSVVDAVGSTTPFHIDKGSPTTCFRIFSNGSKTFGAHSSGSGGFNIFAGAANTGAFAARFEGVGTGSSNVVQFTNGFGQVGTITLSGSSTSYNTSSDHRLKENVVEMTDATTRLKQLQPKRFNFIADADTTVDGFLAHEVQSVVPEAITGTHNEVQVWQDGEELPDGVSVGDNKLDEDGNTIPVYQGIDQSKLVPLLVKTIQELEARIAALENA